MTTRPQLDVRYMRKHAETQTKRRHCLGRGDLEVAMWSKLKEAVTGITQELGLEVPEIPVDLGPLTDTVTSVTDRVTGGKETP